MKFYTSLRGELNFGEPSTFQSSSVNPEMSRFSRSPHSSNQGVRPVGRKYMPEKVPATDKDICGKLFSGRLIAVGAGLQHCRGLPSSGVEDLILDSNPITSFQGFPPMHSLKKLSMNNTSVANFRGFPHVPNLEVISLKCTPVMSHPYARTAVLLLCPRIRVINGEPVTGSERQLCKLYPSECSSLVRSGWMPTIPAPNESDLENISRHLVEKRRATQQRSSSRQPKPITAPETKVKQSEYLEQKIREREMDIERIKAEIEKLQSQ